MILKIIQAPGEKICVKDKSRRHKIRFGGFDVTPVFSFGLSLSTQSMAMGGTPGVGQRVTTRNPAFRLFEVGPGMDTKLLTPPKVVKLRVLNVCRSPLPNQKSAMFVPPVSQGFSQDPSTWPLLRVLPWRNESPVRKRGLFHPHLPFPSPALISPEWRHSLFVTSVDVSEKWECGTVVCEDYLGSSKLIWPQNLGVSKLIWGSQARSTFFCFIFWTCFKIFGLTKFKPG